MKKRRGIKRYYKKLHQCNEWDYWCNILSDISEWCNYAHQHFDWIGYGDICWKERKEHLDILFKHFLMIEHHIKNVERPFQMFAILHLNDSGQDALYFHTPNPYTEYPYIIPQMAYKIGCQLQYPPLSKYLEMLMGQGYTIFTSEERQSCIVFKENVGETLNRNNSTTTR
ncbi:hypothetical protein [Bacteroides sp. GM023]|uniref:hypothetical protein n=1 Tax=Bacteroides sp. GM023 TaxID=2723058 RepID=UPI00168AC4DD|nr:hypothetical protein [Bacteroides sp. GM023]MBD3588139.1 hypothetical protein [Bacteroides sp. GM023]